jgi:hypothetical protein
MEHIEFICEGVPKFYFYKKILCDILSVVPRSFNFTEADWRYAYQICAYICGIGLHYRETGVYILQEIYYWPIWEQLIYHENIPVACERVVMRILSSTC